MASAELNVAFEKIQDPSDWRAPIKCRVHKDEYEVASDACIHFTATELIIVSDDDDFYHCQAVGYRNGPAGP